MMDLSSETEFPRLPKVDKTAYPVNNFLLLECKSGQICSEYSPGTHILKKPKFQEPSKKYPKRFFKRDHGHLLIGQYAKPNSSINCRNTGAIY